MYVVKIINKDKIVAHLKEKKWDNTDFNKKPGRDDQVFIDFMIYLCISLVKWNSISEVVLPLGV